MEKFYDTRYPELSFTQVCRGCWRFVDNSTSSVIGPRYHSKDELLADVERFAVQFGCALAGKERRLPKKILSSKVLLDSTKVGDDAEAVALLEWITRCAVFNMPVGIKAYSISDQVMERARAVVARAAAERRCQ